MVTEDILGNYLGTFVNIVFGTYFVLVTATLLRSYSEALIVSTLDRTPISVVFVTLLTAGFISCYYGLETLARVARLSITYIVFGILLLIISVYGVLDNSNFHPLLGVPFQELVFHSIKHHSLLSEGLLAAVILPALGGWNSFYRAGMLAVGLGGVTLLLIVVLITYVFGASVGEELLLPVFNLSRIVTFGRFFQRIESVFLLTWAMVGFIKLAVSLYTANIFIARALRLDDYRPILAVVTLLCFVISLLPPDLMTTLNYESDYLRSYPGLAATALIPLIMLIISKAKNARRKKPS